MENKNKLTEKEYNDYKKICEDFNIVFPLPKTYYYYLQFSKLVNLNRGFY